MSDTDQPGAKKRTMLENLARIREHVTIAVLVIICASLVLGIVRLAILVFWQSTQVFEAFAGIARRAAPHVFISLPYRGLRVRWSMWWGDPL